MPRLRSDFLTGLLLSLCLLTGMPAALAQPAPPAVGTPIPAFDTELIDGRILSGQSLAGKPLLVMFWATWCPICRKELPQVQRLYERHKAAGLEILALSLDSGAFEVETFWQEKRYTFPVAMRAARHSEIFSPVRTPPRFFLIGRDGRLAFSHVGAIGYDRLEAALKPLL